jgi:dihydropteroate synthase
MSRPRIMGVLNVTPDSFSDGGRWLKADLAIERGLQMVEEGAEIIDVGGESTRPGAQPVDEDEERARVEPVVRALCRAGITVSVDTSKPAVAHSCLAAGAAIINDVAALAAPGMAELCAASGCTVVLMHMKGSPRTMQAAPRYGDVVAEVKAFLQERADCVQAAGVAPQRIWIDPGIGFGKTTAHNLALLRRSRELASLGYPLLIGASRKAFIGRISGSEDAPEPVEERLAGTIAAHVLAQAAGAAIIRAHDVRQARQAADVAHAILCAPL